MLAANAEHRHDLDTDLTAEDWQALIVQYKDAVQRKLGRPFPQDINEQLWGAIGAVFDSWNTARAIKYRQLCNLPESWGTAVNIQAMVFGNRGGTSATGVAFTRNPSTGDARLYGEFLVNAQGEDVKGGEPIVCLTSYHAHTARLVDRYCDVRTRSAWSCMASRPRSR